MTKDIKIARGYSEKIIIKDDDKDLQNATEIFINSLEKQYEDFLKNREKLKENLKKYQSNNKEKVNYLCDFEELIKKSPFTLIDAPWGAGKTYFIENIVKLFIDKKVSSKIFENIIIIDVWRFSSHKEIPVQLLMELSNKLSSLIKDTKKANEFAGKMWNLFKNTFNITLIPMINNKLGTDIPKFKSEYEEVKDMDVLLNEISNEIKPTIVFLDNIERLGKDSWEILKAISKLSEIDNILYIFPMNLSKLKQDDDISYEYPIEKYIDLKYYEFEQDYVGLLEKLGFDEGKTNLFNEILKNQIEGRNLTIREAKQRFNSNNIISIESKYDQLKIIVNKIWGSKDLATEYIKKEISQLITDSAGLEEVLKLWQEKLPQEIIDEFESTVLRNEIRFARRYSYSTTYDFIERFNNVIEDLKSYKLFFFEQIIKEKQNIIKEILEENSNFNSFINKSEDQNLKLTLINEKLINKGISEKK